MSLHICLGDRTFDLHSDGGVLTLDGEPLDAHFERLDSKSGLLILDGETHVITFEQKRAPADAGGAHVRITTSGINQDAVVKGETALLLEQFGFDDADAAAEKKVRAPMPGLVLQVFVEPGQTVEEGQGLVVLEAMKMENELRAPLSGSVAAVHVTPGNTVGKNALLVELA